eukprot:TRINITY_DN1114_c0_g1_i3.p1 TRINITY_DN1114_c0_g1~~TRINITY_DN1114_c0_g1_i3.p1  ORF type:complete len:204 (+),score=52.28 TRINITY_DN1114_c0_g1_i3:70-681(+)
MKICASLIWMVVILKGVVKAGIASSGQQQTDQFRNNDYTSNNVVQEDSSTMYRKLMDMRENLLDKQEREDSEGLKMVKAAIKVILETTIHSFINGFLPTVERVRREAEEEERSYLDGAVYLAGALLGKQRCSQMIACRTGKFFQNKMPGAQLAVMMAESMVPSSMLDWFGVVKKSVIDRSDSCDADYHCTLAEEQVDENKKEV